MALTQQNPQRNGLFSPPLFDDPESIAQISGIENAIPEGGQPNMQPGGIVPKSFTEYAADPVNVSKVAPPIAPNTPMPTLAARVVSSAVTAPPAATNAPLSGDYYGAPGFSPDVQGPPDPAELFPQSDLAEAPKAGPGLMANAAASPAPAVAPAATPAANTPAASVGAPTGPLSREEFLRQHPVQLPGPPPTYQGKKLAAMGLFSALDNVGAFLDHGQAEIGPGLVANARASQEYQRNLPAAQLQAENAAYDEYLKNYAAVRQNTLSPVTTIGPDGRAITTYVDPKTQATLLGANARAGAMQNVAHIKSDDAMKLAEFREMLNIGKVAFTKPIIDEKGNAVWGAFDKYGNPVATLDRSIGPAWLQPTVRTSVQVKENAAGGYDYIPITSTTRRVFPGAQAGGSAPTPPAPSAAAPGAPAAASASAPASAPAPGGAGAASPQRPLLQRPGAGGARPVPTGAVHPVTGANGQVYGKTGGDTGYAVDPQTQQTVLTTRQEADQRGYQQFRKVAQPEIQKDTQVANRLSDVETKLNRYDASLQDSGLTEDDRSAIGKIIRSDKFKLGMFGLEVPVDQVNLWLRENRLGDLSPAGQKALAAYYNARESMSGYQRVLSGSSRGSDKTMELNIDALPKPTDPANYAAEAIKQFRENIPIMRRGLPVLPGVNNGPNGGPATPPAQGGGNVAPEGTIVQVGNQKQIKRNGKWVAYTGQ